MGKSVLNAVKLRYYRNNRIDEKQDWVLFFALHYIECQRHKLENNSKAE